MNDLDLRWRGERGRWTGRWRARAGFDVIVAGDRDGPSAGHLATAHDILGRFDAVTAAVEAFLVALPPDDLVRFRGRRDGVLVRDLALALGGLDYLWLEVTAPDRPAEAVLAFSTGRPDGHVLHEVVLDGGQPTALHLDLW